MVDKLPFGAINPRHMAAWIDNRMAESGIKAQGVEDCIVHLAGSRTRDIVQVARHTLSDIGLP
jgi:hypothetical protein